MRMPIQSLSPRGVFCQTTARSKKTPQSTARAALAVLIQDSLGSRPAGNEGVYGYGHRATRRDGLWSPGLDTWDFGNSVYQVFDISVVEANVSAAIFRRAGRLEEYHYYKLW